MSQSSSIRYLRHEEIDATAWDACIMQSVNRTLYAFSWYLDLVARQWDALILGDYESVFPLPYREKARIRYICMPPFTQQLGLFSPGLISPELLQRFLDAIPPNFRLIDLNLNALNKLESKQYLHRMNRNFELDLIIGKEKLWDGYSTNLKRNLQKAANAGLEMTPTVAPAEIIMLFRHNRGRRIKSLSQNDYRILEHLIHGLMHRRMVKVMGATLGPNALMAAVVMAELPDRSIFLFSATERMVDNHNALAWLIHNYINENAGKNLIFDFEGSNDPGLGRFYAGFGARETSFPSIRIDRLSGIQRLGRKLSQWLKG